MRWLKRVTASLMTHKKETARAEALHRLRLLSPREQIRLGLSPARLREGLKAWPWRLETSTAAAPGLSQQEIRKAEAELGAYTDRELAELAISRGDIPYAVRHGRPGIDRRVA